MPAAAWLRENRLSKNLFVIAPDSTASEAEIAAAMDRHDGLSSGWAGPKPGWYKTVERVGRWWYLIAAALREANKVARPAAFDYDKVGRILAMGASTEPQLHHLCWTASGVGEQGRGAALDQIHELWRRADPEAAAKMDEMIRDTQEKLARFRKDHKD